MTSGARILVSEHSVRAALTQWKQERESAEREAGPERAAASRERDFTRTPADYAAELAPYVFALLQSHAETP